MTDLLQALPDFDVGSFSHILPSLDKHQITIADLLTLDGVDIAKRAQVPPSEVRRLTDVAIQQLHVQLGLAEPRATGPAGKPRTSKDVVVREGWETITTLDRALDAELGGGIPVRYLTEVVGESGAGKTQLLLSLLLAVQLPVESGGLAATAVYISTEAALSTSRLSQVIKANPLLTCLPANGRPTLNKILTMQTPDLESQDHILRYQLPVAIKRHNVRLVVIDSIAANFRAELERKSGPSSAFDALDSAQDRKAGGKAMATRRAQLIQLGSLLRELAQAENIAIVVANQVADRFLGGAAHTNHWDAGREAIVTTQPGERTQSPPQGRTPSASSGGRTQSANSSTAPPAVGYQPMQAQYEPLTLDHQQRFFTGWGDLPVPPSQLKTPSLGLVWANQLACRVALTRDPGSGSGGWSQAAGMKGRRWMRVVFSAWCAPSQGKGVHFEIWEGGLRSISTQQSTDNAEEPPTGGDPPAKRARLDGGLDDEL